MSFRDLGDPCDPTEQLFKFLIVVAYLMDVIGD